MEGLPALEMLDGSYLFRSFNYKIYYPSRKSSSEIAAMTAARLSPAANLLRNSRLFAIPAVLSLPAVEPSSEPISHSDSATTPYPTRAAIETPLTSLNQGDWGLKRPLPIKTTRRSGTPLIRFQRGIDTPEHVVDFESAADHVLTLRKYQELNLRVTLPAPRQKTGQEHRISPFEAELDHTANHVPLALNQNVPTSWLDQNSSERVQHMPKHLKDTLLMAQKEWEGKERKQREREQKEREQSGTNTIHTQSTTSTFTPPVEPPRRWRYSGPYLAGLNGLEFDAFLTSITREKRAAFREVVKSHLIEERGRKQRQKALDEGYTDVPSQDHAEVTTDDIAEHMRDLRNEPGKFGPLIAEFFDLADGPKTLDATDPWSYGRHTIAADLYKETGPPRTHPSAGLSYLKTEASVVNDSTTGPRLARYGVAARLLKSRQQTHNTHAPYVGVAGFVVPQPENPSMGEQNWKWEPEKDGPKLAVTPLSTSLSQAGSVEIKTRKLQGWVVENGLAVDPTEARPNASTATKTQTPAKTYTSSLPPLDSPARRTPRPGPEPNQDIDEDMDFLQNLSSKSRRTNAR